MDELEEAGVGPGGTQALDQAVTDAAAAVDGESRRLVHRDQRVVLEHDGQRARRPGRCRCTDLGRGGPDRRDPHRVAPGQARVRAHAPSVDPDLAGTEDPVQMALRDSLQDPGEEVVDALADGVIADFDLPHTFLA